MCGQQGQTMEASRPILFILVQQSAFMSVDELWIHWVLCTSLLCFAWVAGKAWQDRCRTWHVWTHGCVFSAAHHTVGHLVVMVYIHSGGVLDKLQASRVMLLALHCFHIPSPVGHVWPTRANHGSITSHLVHSCSAMGIHVSGWTLDSLAIVYIFAMLCLGCWQSLARQMQNLTHVDAWLCILSSPPHCWASCCHGVYPQWWRPRQTAGKSSHAPCIALLPYS